jgi:ribonuclease J
LALLADSTNADKPGWTPSEAVIDSAMDHVFREAPGRILAATFASHISRIQQVANAAFRHNRKMALVGTSMVENARMAQKLGYLVVPEGLIVPTDEALKLPPKKVVIMTTGTQGEPTSILRRLSEGRNRQFDIQANDTVVLSSNPIPGNEEGVHRTINRLLQRGAHVIYDPSALVHVSGHASAEEMKLLIHLVKPKHVVPIHGELRHLTRHAAIAREVGIPAENTAVVENGAIIEFADGKMSMGGRVPGGYVYVDGTGVGDIGPSVMREREALGEDGFVIVNLRVNRAGQLVGKPEIISRGFIYVPEAEELFEAARAHIAAVAARPAANLREKVEQALSDFFYSELKRHPMVFALINPVDSLD